MTAHFAGAKALNFALPFKLAVAPVKMRVPLPAFCKSLMDSCAKRNAPILVHKDLFVLHQLLLMCDGLRIPGPPPML